MSRVGSSQVILLIQYLSEIKTVKREQKMSRSSLFKGYHDPILTHELSCKEGVLPTSPKSMLIGKQYLGTIVLYVKYGRMTIILLFFSHSSREGMAKLAVSSSLHFLALVE